MCPLPLLGGEAYLLILILAVGEDVEKLKGGFREHLIPGAAYGLAGSVYAGDPPPISCKRACISPIIFCAWALLLA